MASLRLPPSQLLHSSPPLPLQDLIVVYTPSLVGSLCFTFACFVYLAEVTHSYNVLRPPEEISLSYGVVILNLMGSILFAVASFCYFLQVSDGELSAGGPFGWEYQISEWGVRFVYGVGSACFVLAAILSFPELMSE